MYFFFFGGIIYMIEKKILFVYIYMLVAGGNGKRLFVYIYKFI
jgi:hypothetical protein